MSKFAQIEGHDIVVENTLMELNYVKEGWGEAIGAIATFAIGAGAGLIGGLKAGQKIGGDGVLGSTLGGLLSGLLGFVGGFAGYILFNAATAKKFMKIINHPKVHEYLEKEADTILKEAKKEDKTLLTDYEFKDDDLEKAAEEGKLDVKGVMAAWRYMKSAEIKVGKYNVLLMGDREELKRIVLVLYSQKFNRLVLKDLPVPSREELKAMTSDAAKESMEIAEEGWGTVVAGLGTMAGARLSGVIGYRAAGAITLGSFAAGKYINIKSNGDLAKLFSIDELKQFVKDQCDKILKEEREKDPTVTPDLPGGIIKWIKKQFTDKKVGWAESIMNSGEIKTEVGPYSIYAIGDTDSIGKITVMLYSKDKNNFFVRVVNPPTKDFIAKIKDKY